jgi:hypothetical protein
MSRLNKINGYTEVVDDKIAEDVFNEYQYDRQEVTPKKTH